ncbi:gluconokinase [Allorhizobium taibaishanense]|uniref:Gluconokinase n=1 Tax=Allorhizobium taibaishanense TaxID=887144 RepID=A0A1Q9AA18_9HYPH|nr:gluconokinase [Allorhizobium taibaishanense]
MVLMGVSGCGKSSVGAALAARLGCIYLDGDDLHPPGNIAKMRNGIPLEDEDRWPWLDAVAQSLVRADGTVIIGCSALKRAYRDRIRDGASSPVFFVHLAGSRAVIAGRVSNRPGHFMPAALLDSQFAALEPPQPDERAVTVDFDQPLDELVSVITAAFREELA